MNIYHVCAFNNSLYLISYHMSVHCAIITGGILSNSCLPTSPSSTQLPVSHFARLLKFVCVAHRHQSGGGGAGRLLRGRRVHRQTECDGSTQPSRDTGSHFPQTRSAMMRLTSSSLPEIPHDEARFEPAVPFIHCLLISAAPTIAASLQLSCRRQPLCAFISAHSWWGKQILVQL